MQATALSSLKEQGHLEINLLGADNVLVRTPITQFYSLKEVYDMIFAQCGEGGAAALGAAEAQRRLLPRGQRTL